MKELDADADGILANREKIYRLDFHDVEEYCMNRRDESLSMLLEMSNWVEKRISIFSTKLNYENRSNTNWYGMRCHINRVNLLELDCVTRVWLDDGLHFWWNRMTHRVVFISNNKGINSHSGNGVSNAGDFKKYNFFGNMNDDDAFDKGYERFFDPCHLPADIFKRKLDDYMDYKKLKEDVDADWNLALETKQCLIDAVKSICEDERKFLNDAMELKDIVKKGQEDVQEE